MKERSDYDALLAVASEEMENYGSLLESFMQTDDTTRRVNERYAQLRLLINVTMKDSASKPGGSSEKSLGQLSAMLAIAIMRMS